MSVEDIARRWLGQLGMVTGALHELQEQFGYIDEGALNQLAAALQTPVSQFYGVATFYAAFRLKPRGQHHLEVCHGTACHIRGAATLTQRLERELRVTCGETTADRVYSLEPIRCLGCCGLAPVVRLDGVIHGRQTHHRIGRLLRSLHGEEHHDGKAEH
ncbi:MAG TPA: NAD(P)H-dependent oxidoreductase subunit E [Syntrophobacteraceae bacterium]|nr:NAD(P)H-dependent oxidoreductase subunit E [Syntrophobacteraceae bacterium]